MTTDQDLLRWMAEGTEFERDEALRECIRRYSTMVSRTANRITNRDHDLSDEVTQTVFWILFRKSNQLDEVESLPGWLHATATNVARKAVSREVTQRNRIQALAEQSSHDTPTPVELPAEVDEAILRLPDQVREPVVMHFLGRLTHAEVAIGLGISADAAQKRCSRGIQQLREMLVASGASISAAALVAAMSQEAQAAGTSTLSATSVNALAEFAANAPAPNLATDAPAAAEAIAEAASEFPVIQETTRTLAARHSGGGVLKILLVVLLAGGAVVGGMIALGLLKKQPPQQAAPGRILLSHWKLDETAGNSLADGGGTSPGRAFGNPQFGAIGALADGNGTAIRFDGQDDYLRIEHQDGYLLDNGAVSFYFNPAPGNVDAVLFGKDNDLFGSGGHLMVMLRRSRLEIRIQSADDEYFLRSGRVSNDTWHHIAVNFGAGGLAAYLDGREIGRNAYTGGLGTTSGGQGNFEPILIGAGDWLQEFKTGKTLTGFFRGSIDDVAIYNRPLEPAEIRALYQRLTDPSPVSVDAPGKPHPR